jgi:hypothetical protein
MSGTALQPNRQDWERTREKIRQGTVQVTLVSTSSSRTYYPPRHEKDEWDKQIEEDLKTGKLDDLIQEARRDHRDGKTQPLP